jgi:hypothetical protein
MWRKALGALTALVIGMAAVPALAGDVTLVLVLEPKKFSGKAWDVDRGADPVICIGDGCYRSDGRDRPARYVPGREALGPIVALSFGRKAGACTNKLACVLRSMSIEDGPVRISPIDVDIDRHDRLEERFIAPDTSCRVKRGRLDCYNGIYTREYSLWVVPDKIIEAAGAEVLDEAVSDGVRAGRARFAEEFLSQERDAIPERIAEFYRLVLGETVSDKCRNDPVLMADTFRLANIGTAAGSSAGTAIEHFMRQGSDTEMLDMIATSPRVFWGLQQAIDRFQSLVSVEDVTHNVTAHGLKVADRAGRLVLEVGWKAEDDARDLLDRCEGIDATDLDSILKAGDKS